MNRGGDAPAAFDKSLTRKTVDAHHGRAAQESAELNHIAHSFSGNGDDADGGRFVVHDADCHFIRDDGGECFGGCITGNGDHIETDRTDARPRFEFL